MPRKVKRKIGRIPKTSRRGKVPQKHQEHSYSYMNTGDILTTPVDNSARWDLPDFFHQSQAEQFFDIQKSDSDGCFADDFFVVLDTVYQYSPDTDLDLIVETIMSEKYNKLLANLKTLDTTALGFLNTSSEYIQFISLYTGDNPGVKIAVTITVNFEPVIRIHRKTLPREHMLRKAYQNGIRSESQVQNLLIQISNYNICSGNPDEDFLNIVGNGQILGYFEPDCGAAYTRTIRTKDCALLCPGLRCSTCMRHRGALRKRRSSFSKTQCIDYIHSTKSHSLMTRPELIMKIDQTKQYAKKLENQISKLRKKSYIFSPRLSTCVQLE